MFSLLLLLSTLWLADDLDMKGTAFYSRNIDEFCCQSKRINRLESKDVVFFFFFCQFVAQNYDECRQHESCALISLRWCYDEANLWRTRNRATSSGASRDFVLFTSKQHAPLNVKQNIPITEVYFT